jgi:hypothetical protein
MSEAIGLISIAPSDGYGSPLSSLSETSETTERLVDQEVHRLTEVAHGEVTELLLAHREQPEGVAGALLEVETLDGIDAYRAAALPIAISAPRSALLAHLRQMVVEAGSYPCWEESFSVMTQYSRQVTCYKFDVPGALADEN